MYGIHAISKDDETSIVYVKNPPDIPGTAFYTFSSLARADVDVDLIIRTAASNRGGDIIFTVRECVAEKVKRILEKEFEFSQDTSIVIDRGVSKISVSGEGMQGRPGVAAKVFKCLWDAGVRIVNISTSEIRICMLVPKEDAKAAMNALVDSFEIAW